MTLAVVGATGFIGSGVVAHCRAAGLPVAGIAAPRITAAPGPVGDGAAAWRRSQGDAFDRLCRALEPFDVVVNAAGLATPDAAANPSLFGANAVLPSVVADAASRVGACRLVHVSTAAVQGRLDPLDETRRCFPLSPYAAAKAEGERALLDGAVGGTPEVVVYRPTSVQASGRPVTRRLARIATSLPLVPVGDGGDRPVPVALVENVAAGIVFAASMPSPPPLVLQPWEGLTTRTLLGLFGARRTVSLPSGPFRAAIDLAACSATRSPKLTARLRRVEVLLLGQGVRAEALAAAGFRPPVGREGWEELAHAERAGVVAGTPAVAPAGPAA